MVFDPNFPKNGFYNFATIFHIVFPCMSYISPSFFGGPPGSPLPGHAGHEPGWWPPGDGRGRRRALGGPGQGALPDAGGAAAGGESYGAPWRPGGPGGPGEEDGTACNSDSYGWPVCWMI